MSDPLEKLQDDLRALAAEPAPPSLKAGIAAGLKQHPPVSSTAPRRVRLPWNLGVLDCAVLALCAGLSVYLATQAWHAYSVRATVAGDEKNPPAQELSDAFRAHIAELVKQLDSEDFAQRERAQTQLEKMDERAAVIIDGHNDKNAGPELSTRLTTVVRHIHANAALARLEAVAPGAARALNADDPDGRLAAAVAWAKSIDRINAAPRLVEFSQYADPSPLLSGAFGVLNFWEHGDVYAALAPGQSWHHKEPPPIREVLQGDVYHFSEAGATLCLARRAPKEMNFGERKFAQNLDLLLDGTTAAYYFTADGHVHIVAPDEARQHWRDWWKVAQSTIDWRNAVSPGEQLASWIETLRGDDASAIVRDRARIIEAWDEPNVREAVAMLAEEHHKGNAGRTGAERALEIQTITALRGSGKILYTWTAEDCKLSLWTMNPDGSHPQPLFPDEVRTTERTLRRVAGEKLLLGNSASGLSWWQPGMAAPEEIEAKDVVSAFWRAGTTQVVYLQGVFDEHAWAGALRIYDTATKEQLLMPAALKSGVEEISLSPDGNMVAFTRQLDEQFRSVWTYAIGRNELMQRMKYFDAYKMRSTETYSRWSADSQWLSHFGYDMRGAESTTDTYEIVQNVYTGVAQRLDHLTGEWMPTGAKMLLTGEVNAKQIVKLFEPPATFTELPDLELPTNMATNIVTLPKDRALILNGYMDAGGIWSFAPASTTKPARLQRLDAQHPLYCNPESASTFEVFGRTWMLGTVEHFPGTLQPQIGLISEDGMIAVPITRCPSGAGEPHFMPVSWLKK